MGLYDSTSQATIHSILLKTINFVLTLLVLFVLSSRSQDCGTVDFVGTNGFISSPNYPGEYYNNLRCNYTILAPARSTHTLVFLAFDVEQDYDYIDIRCTTNATFQTIRYSGFSLPQPTAIPWCAIAQINFFTDEVVTYTGFLIQFQVSTSVGGIFGGCGNTVFNESSGIITSPGYPSNYENYHNCTYVIWAPEKRLMAFYFEAFSLELCPDCQCDWLEARCVDDNRVIGRYCGSDLEGLVIDIPDCQMANIWFRSDADIVDVGYMARYSVHPPTTCGNTEFDGPNGVITSPNHPEQYWNDTRCIYTIYSTPGTSHTLMFQSFAVENIQDYIEISCSTNTSIPTIRYTGNSTDLFPPPPVSVPWCAEAQVYFFTNDRIVDTGFSIEYQVSTGGCGSTVFTENPDSISGSVHSPSHPLNYDNNQNCSFIIYAPRPTSIDLHFEEFSLQDCTDCSCDWLQITCIDDDTDYGRHCGSPGPEDIHMSQCQQVLLWFHSDDSVVDSGYNGTFIFNMDLCGDSDFTETSGVITSPNWPGYYYSNLRCLYTIQSSTGSSYTLIFREPFVLGNGSSYIQVSCATNTSFPAIRYSGNFPPLLPVSVTWCADAQIYLYTENDAVYEGFGVEYQVSVGGCGNTVFSGSTGTISSPGFPSYYDNNQNCSYIILASQDSEIIVRFTQFTLQYCDTCSCDWVEIRCLDDNSFYGRYCDSILPTQITMICSNALIWFHSDDSDVWPGFQLQYSINPVNKIGQH